MQPITCFLLSILAIIIFYLCRRNSQGHRENRALYNDKILIEDARKRFIQNQPQPREYIKSNNPRLRISKTPDWKNAYILSLDPGLIIVVPINYDKIILTRSGIDSFDMECLRLILESEFTANRGN